TWTPDAAALDALATADLIILNGANLEPWSQRVSLPIVRTLEVARNFKDQWIRYPAVVTHSHGPEGERSYEGSDGHTWIDPELLRLSAVSIRDRLVRLLPQHRKSLEDRWQQVDAVLSSLAIKISSISTETSVLVLESGPHWGYPAARAGWSLKRIDLDPTGTFDPSLADTLSTLINKSSIRLLLWASTPSVDLATALSEQLQIESVVWPLGFSLGDNYSRYPEIQAMALGRLAEAYSKAAGRP
ncbi:MAG: zinc ABC transporter substrate-binding protein, partial [Planctomycetota bacterium]